MKTCLDNISIVLVEPKEPGNVGACCRAMKNMGIRDLRLVNPVSILAPETFKMCYGADDLVLNAKAYPDLQSAVADVALVVGTTRRKGKHRKPVRWVSEVLPKITSVSQTNRVAVVFGRESKGLFNEELLLCDEQAAIPTRDDFPTLNLAQSVLIVCYELFLTRHKPDPTEISLILREQQEQMYEHIDRALNLMQYSNKGSYNLRNRILKTMRRIFGRSGLEEKEMQMIHGLCSRIESLLDQKQ